MVKFTPQERGPHIKFHQRKLEVQEHKNVEKNKIRKSVPKI
jgi:hypothetical protein